MNNPLPEITQQFQDGTLTRLSNMSELPGIGRYLTARFATQGIHTLAQFVRSFNNLNVNQIRNRLTTFVQNARANQCTTKQHHQAEDFKATNPMEEKKRGRRTEPRYHIRDVNVNGFLVCRALLFYARAHPGIWGRGPPIVLGPIPAMPVSRGQEASTCACFKSQSTCDSYATSCVWIPNPRSRRRRQSQSGNCNPVAEVVGFEGVANYRGQRDTAAKPNRPGAQYGAGWRKSGVVPPLG